MLDEYIGGRMAFGRLTPLDLTPNGDLLYVITNKKQDKHILITINGKTGEIEAITEKPIPRYDPNSKIIQFRQFKKED